MFIDQAEFTIKAGKGGDGAVSFRRERYIPRGGPDGGDGGNGGKVMFIAKNDVHTLSAFRSKKKFEAEDGQNGMHKKMHGKNGQDCTLIVPLGTTLHLEPTNSDDQFMVATEVDLVEENQHYIAARGGNGGWGNIHFATSIKQAPAWSKLGLPGEEYLVKLELKLIADVGLVGLPNAGKSTFLASVSNAKPKIANYPFTTLEPQLGVAQVHDKDLVIADIPGLIEGASQGKGLGHEFLKHIQRTKVLLYVLDGASEDPAKDLATLRKEIVEFDEELSQRPSLVAFNKADILPLQARKKLQKAFPDACFMAASTGEGVLAVLDELLKKSNLVS